MTSDLAIYDYMSQSKNGEGGIYNITNLNLYHYAGNNPVKYTDPDGRTVGAMSVSSFFSTLKNYGLIGLLISVLGKASVDYVEKTEAQERDIQNVIDQIIEDSKPILDIIEDAPSTTTDKTHEEAGKT